ncbi:MAG: choice-of-anchor Q domain-containing protein, partial [Casimicrobium sp.]
MMHAALLLRLLAVTFALWCGACVAAIVTSTADSGTGSLRDAIANAAAGETITFALPANSTIVLASTLSINKPLVISGLSVPNLGLSGGNTTQILLSQAPVGGVPLVLRGLRLEFGFASRGGAIENKGELVLDRVAVVDNRAMEGGGGVFNSGSLLLLHSEVAKNALTSASGIGGGGILSQSVASSTPSVTLLNSTVAFNTTTPSAPGMAGGGIAFSNGALTLLHSTVARNSAPAGGANVHQGSLASTSLRLRGTILSSATTSIGSTAESNLYQPGGATITALAVGGYNWASPRSSASGWLATDLPETLPSDPVAASLEFNGGVVRSLALATPSSVLDAIPATHCLDQTGARLTRDVRAVARGVGGGNCDVGAFELQAAPYCNLDINADNAVTAPNDSVLLNRYLLGYRGADLAGNVPLNAPRGDAIAVANFIGAGTVYDVFGRSVLA